MRSAMDCLKQVVGGVVLRKGVYTSLIEVSNDNVDGLYGVIQ